MGKPKGRAKGVDVTKDFVTGSYSLSETITVFVENNKPVNVAERELVPTVGSESVFSLRRGGKLDAYMKLCTNWHQGQCHNNEQCSFAHVISYYGLLPPPALPTPGFFMPGLVGNTVVGMQQVNQQTPPSPPGAIRTWGAPTSLDNGPLNKDSATWSNPASLFPASAQSGLQFLDGNYSGGAESPTTLSEDSPPRNGTTRTVGGDGGAAWGSGTTQLLSGLQSNPSGESSSIGATSGVFGGGSSMWDSSHVPSNNINAIGGSASSNSHIAQLFGGYTESRGSSNINTMSSSSSSAHRYVSVGQHNVGPVVPSPRPMPPPQHHYMQQQQQPYSSSTAPAAAPSTNALMQNFRMDSDRQYGSTNGGFFASSSGPPPASSDVLSNFLMMSGGSANSSMKHTAAPHHSYAPDSKIPFPQQQGLWGAGDYTTGGEDHHHHHSNGIQSYARPSAAGFFNGGYVDGGATHSAMRFGGDVPLPNQAALFSKDAAGSAEAPPEPTPQLSMLMSLLTTGM